MAEKVIALKINVEDKGQLTQLQANLDQTRRALKQVNDEEKKGTITAKEANAARAQLNTQLIANRNALRDQQRAILQNNDALKKNSGFVAGVKQGVGQWATSMIGVTAAIAGVSKIIGSISTTIKEFDQDMANLKAITGSTDEQMKGFRKSVLDVSKNTGKGASEIAKAFQLVGSAKPELLESAEALGSVTEQAVILAQAGGLEVPAAAEALTKAMNQFGASADEAGKYTDILATSQQKGTATIAQLSESLKNVGAVANSAGLTFEETNAALQALAKGGLTAGEAGTGLRGVLLRLQKAGIGFKDGQFDIEEALKQTQERFDKIQDPVKLATEKTNLFGTENVKTIDTLIAQKDVLTSLNGQLNEYGNAADQAATVTETLNGKTERLGSSWDAFILSLEGSDGSISKIVGGVVDLFDDALQGLIQLNKTSEEIVGDIVNRQLKPIQESGKAQAEETKKQLEGVGLAGKDLADSLDRAALRQAESARAARERGDTNLAATYAAEVIELKRLSKELREGKKETEASGDASEVKSKKEIAAAKKAADEKRKIEEQAFEDKKKREIAAQKELDQLAIQSIADERTREKIATAAKFQDKIDALKQDSEQEKQLALALKQSKKDALRALDDKFKAEDEAKALEERQLELENALIKAEEDFEQQNLILEQQRQLELSNEELTAAQREAINLKYDQQIAANTKAMTEAKKQEQLAALSVVAGAFDAIASLAEEGSNEAKALATVSAIINSYLAYTNALANTPAPAPFPQIAAASALLSGLAQVKKINQTKKAAKGMYLEDGGMINGASHKNGGVPFTVDGRTGFEAEGGEAIINKRSTALFRPLLSEINQAGGGVAFERGGMLRKFQSGGALPTSLGVTASQQSFAGNTDFEQLSQTISSSINQIEVVNVATNTSQVASEVINTQSEATF